jgi:hypothetical protein
MNPRVLLLPLAAAVVAGVVSAEPARAQTPDELHIASNITYDVHTSATPVRVTWDVEITNNDPATRPDGSGSYSYYYTVNLPVVRGAAGAAATDSAGRALGVSVNDVASGVAQSAAIAFAEPLEYGESYAFRLNYVLSGARSEGILVTPTYAYLPLITAGDESSVVVHTPPGDPWETTLEQQECTGSGGRFACSGSGGSYVAATVEVAQPAAVSHTSFNVPMQKGPVAVELAYLKGEDAAAGHQRELITAALPLLEQAYGVPYDGPAKVRVSHGGQQAILGYEGLATCSTTAGCELTLSPVADDYTVLHELAHLWSDLYAERWLAEGYAELVAHKIAFQVPAGVFQGYIRDHQAAVNIQLDDWGEPESIIDADVDEMKLIEAGYDYSLAFLQELEIAHGPAMLQTVNKQLVAGGPADSRRFMDLAEAATGEDLGDEFLLWVFPPSYETILQDRRDARLRLQEVRGRLEEAGVPAGALTSIEAQVTAWQFKEALGALEQLESNLATYAELSGELEVLKRDAEASGLILSDEIGEALERFDFNAARKLLTSSRLALDLYREAAVEANAPRSTWEQFGLLGTDPDEELDSAAEAFEEGQFTSSASRSERVLDLVSGASAAAFRRLLAAAGLLALIVAVVGSAVAYSRWRDHRTAHA